MRHNGFTFSIQAVAGLIAGLLSAILAVPLSADVELAQTEIVTVNRRQPVPQQLVLESYEAFKILEKGGSEL